MFARNIFIFAFLFILPALYKAQVFQEASDQIRCSETYREEWKNYLEKANMIQRFAARMTYTKRECKLECEIRLGPILVRKFEEINAVDSTPCKTNPNLPWNEANKMCKSGRCEEF